MFATTSTIFAGFQETAAKSQGYGEESCAKGLQDPRRGARATPRHVCTMYSVRCASKRSFTSFREQYVRGLGNLGAKKKAYSPNLLWTFPYTKWSWA
jgi:hypothetical protein